MGEVNKEVDELKSMLDLDIIPDETKEEIRQVLTMVEKTMEYDSQNKINNKVVLNFKNTSSNKNPDFATYGDSGFDLRADIDDPIVLKPLQRTLVPTGLYFELPKGYDMEIRSRSGLAFKNGVMVLNSPGTIDLGYRGEIKVILINLGQEDFTIKKGDRIAQGLIRTSITSDFLELKEVNKISDNTDRGGEGFGSTGTK
jgi:dUTP pyrophosphatase